MNKYSLLILVIFVCCSNISSAQLSELDNKLLLASPNDLSADEYLSAYVTEKAEESIKQHCVSCHGENLKGQLGVADLTDSDWLWGVTGFESTSIEPVLAIMQTITFGIRNTDCSEEIKSYGACPDTHFSQMPGFQEIGFNEQQISDLTDYTLSLSGELIDNETVDRGRQLWPVCIECHGEEGYGYKAYGGPDLSDDIWLFGDTREQIENVIAKGRQESCPAWGTSLDAVSIKALSLYIYNLSD